MTENLDAEHAKLMLQHDCDAAVQAGDVDEWWSEMDADGKVICRACPRCQDVKLPHIGREPIELED